MRLTPKVSGPAHTAGTSEAALGAHTSLMSALLLRCMFSKEIALNKAERVASLLQVMLKQSQFTRGESALCNEGPNGLLVMDHVDGIGLILLFSLGGGGFYTHALTGRLWPHSSEIQCHRGSLTL